MAVCASCFRPEIVVKESPQRWSSCGVLHCKQSGHAKELTAPVREMLKARKNILEEASNWCLARIKVAICFKNVCCPTWWLDIPAPNSFCDELRETKGWHTHHPSWKFMKYHFKAPNSGPRPVQIVKEPSWHWPGRDAPRPPSIWCAM